MGERGEREMVRLPTLGGSETRTDDAPANGGWSPWMNVQDAPAFTRGIGATQVCGELDPADGA